MRFSVLIPIYLGHRPTAILERALDAWEKIDYPRDDFDLVLACDGADARVDAAVRDRELDIRVLHGERRQGQSAASNRAARAARGDMLLFSAQDILPDSDLLRAHDRAHAAHESPCVILGNLPYPEELRISPFMDFLVNGGPQFAYFLLADGAEAMPQFLYAPNFSIERRLFERIGGFREDLPYACQDSELGLRLRARNIRMYFHADAVGHHWHPQELDDYLERQRIAGRNTVKLARMHPRYAKLDHLKTQVLFFHVGQRDFVSALRERVGLLEQLSVRARNAQRVAIQTGLYGGWIELDALQYCYDRITKYCFFEGVHEELSRTEGGAWLTRDFHDWVTVPIRVEPRFFDAEGPRPVAARWNG